MHPTDEKIIADMRGMAMQPVLEDVLVSGLRVVFVGTAAGPTSAMLAAYYASQGNRFWPTLSEVGLTPYQLRPAEFRDLPKWGIGLTDLAKLTFGSDAKLTPSDFDVIGFTTRIKNAKPEIVAFNGKNAASIFLGRPNSKIEYGPHVLADGFPTVHVLPSTSRASGHWSRDWWEKLADRVREMRSPC